MTGSKVLFDSYDGKLEQLVSRLPDTASVLAELKRNPHVGYWENEGAGLYVDPKWLRLEKALQIHALWEEGSGNTYFISAKTKEIWSYDHEGDGGKSSTGDSYGTFTPDSVNGYTLDEPYKRLLEHIKEMEIKGYKSPYAVQRPGHAPKTVAAPPSLRDKLTTYGSFGLIGATLGSVAGNKGAAVGAVLGGIAGHYVSTMDETTLYELADDPDVFFSDILTERGHGGASKGHTDVGVGDRALAAQSRIGGLDQLRPLLSHLQDAMRAGGWESGDVTATVRQDTHDDAPGRDWSLRGALAEAEVRAPTESPCATDADAALHYRNLPHDAVLFEDGEDCLIVRIQYMSDGMGKGAVPEMAAAMHDAGMRVTEEN